MFTIGAPVYWTTSLDKAGTVTMKMTAKVVEIRADGRYVVRFVGRTGRPVERIARVESLTVRTA